MPARPAAQPTDANHKELESQNCLTLRECLSSQLLQRATDADASTTADELSEFTVYLCDLLFASLPLDLQRLTPSVRGAELAVPSPGSFPPECLDSLSAYRLTSNPAGLLEDAVREYVAAATAAPAYAATRTSECEICEREVPLTYHHLIPRAAHSKVKKRGWHEEWRLNSVAWLCRPCHSFVHRVASNEELAKEWYTVERLVEREDVQKWRGWVAKQRWGMRK